ncbi:MAG: methyltransferase [Roseovarius confluentis]
MNVRNRAKTLEEVDFGNHPSLQRVCREQVGVWPAHEATLATSLRDRSTEVLRDSEIFASLILRIAEDHSQPIRKICTDYRYFCEEMILKAELFFRRNKRYERSTFEEAYNDVYADPVIMEKYMNGLLLSGLFWINHANALTYYRTKFLAGNVEGYDHLEVGPGHGTLLYFAATDPRMGSATGWDVSPGAIDATRRTLAAIGVDEKVSLVCQNLYDAPGSVNRYDSIVVSEVLEHLEDPKGALVCLHDYLKPGGRIYVNMPANSPAPDHIFLITDAEETLGFMREAGFEIEQRELFPMTGYSLEQCRKHALTVNCAAIGRKKP